MRKILLIVLAVFCGFRAHCAEMVNVEYIHNAIKQKWDITVPYNAALENPRVAANMKYLLTAVDVANEILNGGATTDYGNGEFATLAAADTIATNTAVDTLVKFTPKFFITTNSNVTKFKFDMSARGRFFVDWGDGTTEIIDRATTADTAYEHTYATSGEYKIKLGGVATGYATDGASAIRFENAQRKKTADIVDIAGSIGAIFPTIGDGSARGSQPSFERLFYQCTNLGSDENFQLPSQLFAGVHGAPIENMFKESFYKCNSMYGGIPEDLFAGISGAPAPGMFWGTFAEAISDFPISGNLFAGIRGAPAPDMFRETFASLMFDQPGGIPDNLFAGIRGVPAARMFMNTFASSDFNGSIPESLFAGISGAPAESMFDGTFSGCRKLSGSIPGTLFAGVRGVPAKRMFAETFGLSVLVPNVTGNVNMTGEIPEDLFSGIRGTPAEGMFANTFTGASGLSGQIPSGLFSGIVGAPAPYMFSGTFGGCYGLGGEIPSGLFAGISGVPAERMFYQTFASASGLTGIGDGLFGDLSGPAASNMFSYTFETSQMISSAPQTFMTGLSARTTTGKFLYEIWPDATTDQVGSCYSYSQQNLDDWGNIPANWGGFTIESGQ